MTGEMNAVSQPGSASLEDWRCLIGLKQKTRPFEWVFLDQFQPECVSESALVLLMHSCLTRDHE